MSKVINFEYEGKKYTLEYDRASVAAMEKRGFRLNNLDDMPASTLPALFSGAFIKNHKYVKPEVINTIFDSLCGKREIFAKLGEMYGDALNSLVDDDSGNVTWEASW